MRASSHTLPARVTEYFAYVASTPDGEGLWAAHLSSGIAVVAAHQLRQKVAEFAPLAARDELRHGQPIRLVRFFGRAEVTPAELRAAAPAAASPVDGGPHG